MEKYKDRKYMHLHMKLHSEFPDDEYMELDSERWQLKVISFFEDGKIAYAYDNVECNTFLAEAKFAVLKPRRYVVCEMNFENFEKFVIQNRVNFKEIRNYKPHNYEVFGTCFSRRFKIAPKSGKSIRACVTSVLIVVIGMGKTISKLGSFLGGICASARVSQ